MKFWLGVFIGILMLVFVFQNTKMVEVNFISWKLSTPRSIMLILFFAFGATIGYLARFFKKKHIDKKNK